MSEAEIEHDTKTGNGVTASKMLSSAREALGLTQKEVADQLYLTTSFIRSIDEGSFEKISKPAFIKGYLRSYARTVELDGDEVVALYDEALQAVEENVRIRDVTEETVGSVAITGPVIQTGLVGLFGVVIVVGMVWWIASSGKEDDGHVPRAVTPQKAEPVQNEVNKSDRSDFDFVLQESQADSAAGSAVDSVAELNEDSAKTSEPASDESSETIAASNAEETIQERSVAGSGPVQNEISVERNRDGGINYITVDANGFDEVEATFLDDCWLEVEDGNGDPVYGDLNKSGDILRIYGVAPFKLLIGRADALSLTFNGDDIDLARYTAEDETAKVTLNREP